MKNKGFTLTELLVAVAIAGIIASIALPSYQANVRKGARSDGMTELLDMMRAQENYFANRFTYTTDLTKLNYNAAHNTSTDRYSIVAELCDDGSDITECVKLVTSAQNGQEDDGDLTLDSRGNKTHRGQNGWLK